MSIAYIAMGANLFFRKQYLWKAANMLTQYCVPLQSSSIYETEPFGFVNQGMFLNCVMSVRTNLEPHVLLHEMLGIEQRLGRKREVLNGPRTIDLDLLLFEDLVLSTDTLTLPHPRMHERDFVLLPFLEIAPNVVHPVLQQTIEQLGGHYVHSKKCVIYR